MYRPTPADLAALLPDWTLVKSVIIQAGRYNPSGSELCREVLRAVMPFYKPRGWWQRAHQLLWLFRPYEQTIVLMKK
jgi:hypothetical protein